MTNIETLIAYWETELDVAMHPMDDSDDPRLMQQYIHKVTETIAALRQKQGEPFGYIGCDAHTLISGGEKVSCTFSPLKICDDDVPLYASPQQQGEQTTHNVEDSPKHGFEAGKAAKP